MLESVSIASALSTALTIYQCQIRVHQRWQSKLQLPTSRKKEWRPATAGSSPHAVTCQHCDTHYFSRPLTRNLPIVGWLLVRGTTSSATDSPHLLTYWLLLGRDVIVSAQRGQALLLLVMLWQTVVLDASNNDEKTQTKVFHCLGSWLVLDVIPQQHLTASKLFSSVFSVLV